MKQYKSIEWAYPSSPHATRLGFGKQGCWSIDQTTIDEKGLIQYIHWMKGYAEPDNPELIAEFMEAGGTIRPYFLTYGNQRAIDAVNQALKQNKQQTNMNTYEKVSAITSEQIINRMQAANKRYSEAVNTILNIASRKTNAVVKVPYDAPMPEIPSAGEMPQEVFDAVNSRGIHYTFCGHSTVSNRKVSNAGCMLYDHLQLKPHATPAQLVAAIRALDGMADELEVIKTNYVRLAEATVEQHVASQVSSVSELAGLVAQV